MDIHSGTDRHKGIRKYIRTQHPKIMHEFDIWHLSKSLMKRFRPLEKKYLDAFLWKSSINNHLWWSAQTCEGNGKLLVDNLFLYYITFLISTNGLKMVIKINVNTKN